MAQLKDTLIQGSARITDTLYTTTAQTQILRIPTTSNGTTYGVGANGQIPRSNGTSIYWSNPPATGVTSITIQTSSPLSGGSATATTGTGSYTIGFANQNKNIVLAGPSSGNAAAPTFRALVADDIPTISASKASLGNVSNNANLNGATGAKGDIIYWSAANTPAHLTNTSSTTKHFLSITSQTPSWVTLSKSDVGLGNVDNTADANKSVSYATSAGTANAVAWANVSGKPINFYTNSQALNSGGWAQLGGTTNGSILTISYSNDPPANWNSSSYSSSILFGCQDTKGLLDCAFNTPVVTFGGGSSGSSTANDPVWYFKLSGTTSTTYNLDNFIKVDYISTTLTDCNNVAATGIWTSQSFGNKPTEVNNWGSLFNIRLYNTNNNYHRQLFFDCYSSNKIWTRSRSNGQWNDWKKLWMEGDAITGAVWNDYAEYRAVDTIEPGYVVFEKGDDTLTKTTDRLQHFAGVTSDTWGFAQGETKTAKTPIAVAGRVLVYTYQDRNNYKPGDCVCAAPNGTIDIMTREEIIKYPDRIVGTVSCVPTYKQWGDENDTNRRPVKVNNRIWIKVK